VTPDAHPADRPALDAVIFDLGGTLIAEASATTSVANLVARPFDGVLDDLRVLVGRTPLALATNTSIMSESDVRRLLVPCGLDELFAVVVTSCDVGVAKPDPACLIEGQRRLGLTDPIRILFVGDRDTDEHAAIAAGMPYAEILPAGALATVDQWIADHG
jgi:FMN phosphatase YigB (HAD superfamily)